jgi:hypothetical protein
VVEIGDGDHGPCGCWSGKVHRHSLCAFKSRVDTPPQIFQYYACHKFVFIVIQFSQILYSVFYLFIFFMVHILREETEFHIKADYRRYIFDNYNI